MATKHKLTVQHPIFITGQLGWVEPAAKLLDASDLAYDVLIRWGDHDAGEGQRLTCTQHILPDGIRGRSEWEYYAAKTAAELGWASYWLIEGHIFSFPGYPDARTALHAAESGKGEPLRGTTLILSPAIKAMDKP